MQSLREITELAQARERSGEWQAAAEVYATMFRYGVEQRAVDAIVDALRSHARVHTIQLQFDEAEELACLSWEIAERAGLASHAARAINMVAYIHYHRGDLPAAKRLYEHALEQARDIGDDSLIGFVCQNLGVIANIQGNLREARALYLESISASIRDQNDASAMMAYSNLGMVCTDLADFMEAELYFDRGIEIAERLGDAAQLGRLYVNRAEPLIQMDELERALASLDKAEQISAPIRNLVALVEAARFRGRIARLQGEFSAAERHIENALAICAEGGLDLSRGEVLEEMGALREREGRYQDALASYREALEVFRQFGATQDAARLEVLLQRFATTSTDQVPLP